MKYLIFTIFLLSCNAKEPYVNFYQCPVKNKALYEEVLSNCFINTNNGLSYCEAAARYIADCRQFTGKAKDHKLNDVEWF